ncbi:AP-1 complex subunit beta-1 [Blyttiomyces sp. JEL0837]|nr:AP-1 complex subunit beta-1 [Blyttiomyces sp. JEL0837]
MFVKLRLEIWKEALRINWPGDLNSVPGDLPNILNGLLLLPGVATLLQWILETVRGVEENISKYDLNLAFAIACYHGHVEVAKFLFTLKNPYDVTLVNKALQNASRNGHCEVLRLLLEQPGVDATADNNFAIRMAAANGHSEVLRLLLEQPRVDATADDNFPIRMASANGHSDVVELLMAIEAVDPSVEKELCHTMGISEWSCGGASNGNNELIKVLLKFDAVDSRESIRVAARNGHTSTVALLLRHNGIFAAAKNEALAIASEENYLDIMDLLLSGNRAALEKLLASTGNIRVSSRAIINAIQWAADCGHTDLVRFLFAMGGINAGAVASELVCKATCRGYESLVKFLIGVDGVDVTANNNEVLREAAGHGFTDIVSKLLTVKNVDVAGLNNEAIRKASAKGRANTVRVLLTVPGVNALANNNEVLRMAAANRHLAIVKMLLKFEGIDAIANQNKAIRKAIENEDAEMNDVLIQVKGVNPFDNNHEAERLLSRHRSNAIKKRLNIFKSKIMADAKYFQRGKIQELRAELNSDKRDSKHTKKRVVLKKIVANMTMGNDMSPLFSDVVACMQIPVLEIKKMVYLYLVNYAKNKPDLAKVAINGFVKDLSDPNPLIRALSLRTMGYLPVDKVMESLADHMKRCLDDRDPYVAKTAAIAVSKLFAHDRALVERMGFLNSLRNLLNHENSTVVANAVAALTEIADKSEFIELVIDFSTANKLLTALNECSEWGQVYILESMLFVVPQDHNDAELLAERVIPRLQHANSAVVLSAVRVVLYMMNYILKDDIVDGLFKKLGPPLVTLLHNGPEVQYVALRNTLLLLQRRPDFLKNEIKVFFCKYNDPIYVKLAKLEIMFRLATEENIDQVLPELREYASEVDIDFIRKSVRAIGRCAIKIDIAADRCIQSLIELIQTKVNYVVQEAVVVIKDIFRKYPNRYESVIATLCDNLDSLDEPEAKASMIWIIGQYSDRIENAADLLEQFLENFKEESSEVQLSLLTAIVKLFIKRPTAGQDLIPKVLKWATEEVDNPDLRDRGFIYWRLLSTNPIAAKAIVLSEKPPISTETENLAPTVLEELLLNISTLASIYHKQPTTFLGNIKPKRIELSSALVVRDYSIQTNNIDNGIFSQPVTTNFYGDDSHIKNVYVEPTEQQEEVEEDTDAQYTLPNTDMDNNFQSMYQNDLPIVPDVDINLNTTTNQTNLLDLDFLSSIDTTSTSKANTATSLLGSLMDPSLIGPASLPPPQPPQPNMYQNNQSNPFGVNPSFPGAVPSQFQTPYQPTPITPQQPGIGGVSVNATTLDPFAKTSGSQPQTINPNNPFGQPQNMPPPQMMQQQSDTNVGGQMTLYGSQLGMMMGQNPTAPSVTTVADGMAILNINPMTNMTPRMSLTAQPSGYVPIKSVMMTRDVGKGLEITGTFARRQGRILLELTLFNYSIQPLSNFAMLFNKNSFCLAPATPLQVPAIYPNQSFETVVGIKTDGLQLTTAVVNNLQIAIKCNAGILYFQTLVPLHILFTEEGSLEQETWLKLWREEIPSSNESIHNFNLSRRYGNPEEIRDKLHRNNVFTIAQRTVEGNQHFFTAVKLTNGALFLSDLQLDSSLYACTLSTKTPLTTAVGAYEAAVVAILNSE